MLSGPVTMLALVLECKASEHGGKGVRPELADFSENSTRDRYSRSVNNQSLCEGNMVTYQASF